MKKVTFKELTLTKIEKTFGLSQVWKSSILEEWEKMSAEITEAEKDFLEVLRDRVQKGGKAWNETELENKFISPLITFAKIDTDEFGYFLERPLQGIIGEYELSGIVDGMIATGIREPDIPFFCLHEYKRSVDNEGNPDAQALAAMLVARVQNENSKPIYGLYIVGLIWNFIVLDENEYCISKDYNSSQEEIYDIFRMMKALKVIIQTKLLGK
ncbi:MAG: hypothetical protein MUE81_05775 [Thermoflexibacter sp.]|jgi:hypothetical protein|nr:hypothetical protein [Thermoflexibacter sp.]